MSKTTFIILEGKSPDINVMNIVHKYLINYPTAELIFGLDIYQLYQAIKNDVWFQKTGELMDTLQFIRDQCNQQQQYENNKVVLEKYEPEEIGFIYLFFDLDPWAQNNKTKLADLREMLELFNNATEPGKLFINYPCVESFNHITENFRDLSFTFSPDCVHYKKISSYDKIAYNKYVHITNLKKNELFEILEHHLMKANYICNNLYEIPGDISSIEQLQIYDKQYLKYIESSTVYVLSSATLYLIELFGYSKIKSLMF